MTSPSLTLAAHVYQGTHCICVRLAAPPGRTQPRYGILTIKGRTIGTVRWHPRQRQYVLVPQPDTAWTSRDLAEVGLWLRRLTREVVSQAVARREICDASP